MPLKSPRVYLLEKLSIFLLSLFISFIFIFGVACLVAYNAYKSAIYYTIRSNETRANLSAKVILDHQRATIGVLRSYRSRRLLVDSVKKKDFEETVRHLKSLVENNPEIESTFITDPVGTLWVNFPISKESINQNLSYSDWYKGVSKQWTSYVSNLWIVGEKDLAVAVCSPIRDEKGKVIGILAAVQTTVFFKRLFSEIGLDVDGKTTLVDQEGHIVYSNRFPYKKEVVDFPPFEFVKKATKGEKGDIEIRDSSDGDRVKYVSFAPIQGIGWSVIVEKGKGDVFQSQFIYLIQLLIISFLIFTVVVFSLSYLRQKHKQMTALQESESRLQLLTSKLLTAQENERKRVAHELHDSIGASLTGIKFQIENAIGQVQSGNSTLDSLQKVIPTVQKAVEESRRIQMNLRPSLLDDLGILPTIEWHCREFQKMCPHIRFEKRIELTEDQVPQSLKIVIYRVFQEALNNIAKHSKADLVTMSLRKTGDPIELAIQDNGQGFNVEETLLKESYKQGLGLSSMRERVELTGGSFSIESDKGVGTIIRATWPIK